MRQSRSNLDERGRATYTVSIAFLENRLDERATVDWALSLKPSDSAKRIALIELLNHRNSSTIAEPWRAAWRLIFEYWDTPRNSEQNSTSRYKIQKRVEAGDFSDTLISEVVALVAPRIKVEPFTSLHLHYRKLPKNPKRVHDLFSTGITSGETIDPADFSIPTITDETFLILLGNALNHAVSHGMDIARRIGWDGVDHTWTLGTLNRVYYVSKQERGDGNHEPDEFQKGLAPSVKMLHAVVSQLLDINVEHAIPFIQRWRSFRDPIHRRLTASFYVDTRIAELSDLSTFFQSLTNREFWDVRKYPEITELRAKRFSDFPDMQQSKIASKIVKLPPRNLWPRNADSDRIDNARLYWSVRELLRIRGCGGSLPNMGEDWVSTNSDLFPQLANGVSIDKDFLDSPKAHIVPNTPDRKYDTLENEERLRALDSNLSKGQRHWDDGPAKGAEDWIMQSSNAALLISDFESIEKLDNVGFSSVWDRFGWLHRPVPADDDHETGHRVLALLAQVSESTLSKAISGISNWVSTWKSSIVNDERIAEVWHRLWPHAVNSTNDLRDNEGESEPSLSSILGDDGSDEVEEIDTLNPPVGKLVGVFLRACPDLKQQPNPFAKGSALSDMRAAVTSAQSRAGLIGKHRMTESLPYFLEADPDWTRETLIDPLVADSSEALALWEAIARQMHRPETLKIIGQTMAERVVDSRLSRNTRQSLVFNLVIDSLHAYRTGDEPSVDRSRIQQMIRTLDDEVRAYAANAIQRFVSDMSAVEDDEELTPERLYLSAAEPFIENVWPQERSLATAGVSRAFANLPATVGTEFSNAVNAIRRFLVPFECWSLSDYGLYSEGDAEFPNIEMIDTKDSAEALLTLLDLTIGTSESAVIPDDLVSALQQIEKVSLGLAKSPSYRRLATAARR